MCVYIYIYICTQLLYISLAFQGIHTTYEYIIYIRTYIYMRIRLYMYRIMDMWNIVLGIHGNVHVHLGLTPAKKNDHFKGQMTSNHGVKGHFELLGIDVDLHIFIYILLLAMGWLIHSIVLWNRNQIYTYWQILALNRGGMLEGFRDPQFGF